MRFTIKTIKTFTSSNGKGYARATLTNEHGAEFDNVTIWSPLHTRLVGDVLEGNLTPNDYNGKRGWKYESEKTNTLGPKANQVAVAQAAKAKSIEVAQERKNDSIKVSSTFRDATILTAAMIEKGIAPFATVEDVQRVWTEQREWLWKQFDKEDSC